MDWDLWSSPFDQVVSDDSYSDSEYPEWQYIYFGREHDLIEEDALNVASCIQVLRILITNADTEIEGLEKDLLSLQNELAWAEHEKWPEICYSALTERINLLDVAISTLKNEHADDTEVQLLLHNKPAETLNEIVEALQRDHCQNTIGQQLDVNTLKPIVNDTEHALDKDCSSVDSNIIIKEEGNELYGTSENFKGSEFLLELHEKRSSAAENIEESLAKSPVASPNLGAICCAPDHSDGMKLPGTSDNKVTENEEIRRSQLITTYTGQIVNLISSKDNGNNPREVKESLAKSPVESPDLGAICCAPDHSDGMKLSGTSDNQLTEYEEVGRSQLITTYTGQIVNLISSKGNGNIPREVKESHAKSPVASPDLGAICCAPDHSDWMKLSGTSDNKVTENEEVGRSQLISTYTGQIVNLISSKCNGNIPREVKESLAKSPVVSPDLGAICCAPDHSDEMKLSGTSDNKVTENEEVRRSQLITTYTGQIVNLVSSKGNGNIPIEVKKENAIDKEKDVISDDLRFESGVKGRENCLHSRLHASQHKKSGNSDLDKKLCDFAPKTARRACKKEFKVAPAEDLDSMKLPLQVVYPQELCVADTELCSFKGSDDDHSQKMMSIENTCLINAENSASISLLEMQTKSAPYTGLQLTDEEKQAQGLKSKSAANLSRSNMSTPSKLKANGKRKAELEPFSSREPLDSPTEVDPITSIVVSTKRQCKSKTSTGTVSFNESMNSRIMKSAVQPGREEAEDRAIVPYDSEFSELQKKMRVSKFPITTETQNSAVNLDIPYSDKVSIDNGSQVDVDICKSCSLEGSHNETSTLLSNSLKSLTLHSLRALAKQHNVQKYYKLTKGLLIEQLIARLGNC